MVKACTSYFGNHQVDNESADILTENKIINNETLDEQEQAIIDESQKDIILSESTIFKIDPMINMEK